MFRNEHALPPIDNDVEFDLIVVGSGNGACGFLGECLKHVPHDYRILVLEQGQNYFYTSDVTHQAGWSKTYSSGDVFQLHNAVTTDGRSVLSGRAKAMGGGGSINYTMIFESSEWLVEQAGWDVGYWDRCKSELALALCRPDPFEDGYETPFAKFISQNAQDLDYLPPNPGNMVGHIPSLTNKLKPKQLYIFPTQFNRFGQRTNSGVSLVDWERVTYRWNTDVTGLVMEASSNESERFTCTGIETKNNKTGVSRTYKVRTGTGRVILCAGSQSPRLLLQTNKLAERNEKIGTRVNDHICMPLGIYFVNKDQKSSVGPTDNYESLFATMKVVIGRNDEGAEEENSLVNLDFFSGDVLRLIYLISSLYLCYLPLNGFKRLMGRNPIIFTYLSNIVRVLLTGIIYIIQFFSSIIRLIFPSDPAIVVTTALVKFNAIKEGHYEKKGDRITLCFFEDDKDSTIAEEAINKSIELLEKNGAKPNFLFRVLFQFLTKIPYEKGREVKRYVRHFARKTLLSEQHLAGGCLFGDVVDKGLDNRASTGKVFGSVNVHVADLSVVPLPRVSTQMTAYLMGHHVAKQLYSTESKNDPSSSCMS